MKTYRLVLDVVKRVHGVRRLLRQQDRSLADQLGRCSQSVALNLMEGMYSRGGRRPARLQVALASAKETVGCLEVAEAVGYLERDERLLDDLDHVVASLWLMVHRPR